MLYNPKWENSTARFIAWLETQPPETEYNWHDVYDCLACRYLKAVGVLPANHFGSDLHRVFASHTQYWHICGTKPWTFGAALERARIAVAADA